MKRLFVWTLTFLLTFPTVLPAQDTRIYPSRTTLPFLNVATYIQFPGGARLTDGSGTLTFSGGQFLLPIGSNTAPSLASVNNPTDGLFFDSAGSVSINVSSVQKVSFRADRVFLNTQGDYLYLDAGTTGLQAEGNNIIQQGIDAASPVAQLFKGPDGSGADKAGGDMTFAAGRPTGTGTGGSLYFSTASAAAGSASSQNALVNRWQITSLGHLLASTDSLWNIGSSGANRPLNMYIASGAYARTLSLASDTYANRGLYAIDASATFSAFWCGDCTQAYPCAGGGTGAIAKKNGTQWVCN